MIQRQEVYQRIYQIRTITDPQGRLLTSYLHKNEANPIVWGVSQTDTEYLEGKRFESNLQNSVLCCLSNKVLIFFLVPSILQ